MKKMFLLAVAIVAVLALIVVGIASMRPGDYHIERTIETSAPPAKVFVVMSDFNRYSDWSPWAKLDPNLKPVVTGTAGTAGQTYTWDGNSDVGSGKMTMTEAAPERMVVKLEFLKPFPANSTVTWTIKDTGHGSAIVWAMDGVNEGTMPKVFALLTDLDSLIGKDFETGLANLKGLVEKS